MDTKKVLNEIANQVAVCTRCELHFSRKKAVPGEGPADAEVMLIGEGPGFYENEQGRPFVGAAGKFLDELLEKGGIKREAVFITNVVKCRPPGNRDPLPEELEACDIHLRRQIEAINPSIIVTLGRFSMNKFMPGAKISTVHGQMRKIGDRYVIAMYHPAAALHQASMKPAILADFAKLPALLKEARAGLGKNGPAQAAPQAPKEAPKQLNLF